MSWPAVAVTVIVEVPAGVPEALGVVLGGIAPVTVLPQPARETIINRPARASAGRSRISVLLVAKIANKASVTIASHKIDRNIPTMTNEPAGLAVVATLTVKAAGELPVMFSEVGETEQVAWAGAPAHPRVTVPVSELGASCRL